MDRKKKSFTSKKTRQRAPGLYAAVLAGGIGSRFWPLSRETSPKQLLKVAGTESLLKSTITRLQPLIPPERVMIVTNAGQAETIRLHLTGGSSQPSPGFVIEPMGRNTAPAIALAAMRLHRADPDGIMAVLPADHLVGDRKKFTAALKAGLSAALEGHLVTFGIKPTKPETGYGYIKAGSRPLKKAGAFGWRAVERFVEKPDIKRARRYLKDGAYLWNSGIFVWKASRILEEAKTHLPALYNALEGATDTESLAQAYKKIEGVSIDHGILEKAKDVVVIPVDFPWSDVGSWNSFADIFSADKDGNVIKGRVVDIGSRDSIIIGCDRAVATIGLRGMVIVDTPDATLVCPRERAQEVKDIVGALKKKGFSEQESHRTVDRPWGSYTVLEKGEGYKIKKVYVAPGRRLSLQMHTKRSEHWVVISGIARVRRGDEIVDIAVNQSTYIPRGVKHRLENPGDTPLEIIEVQNGEYVEEDDIVRFDDDFGR